MIMESELGKPGSKEVLESLTAGMCYENKIREEASLILEVNIYYL